MSQYLKIFDSVEYETNEINEKRYHGLSTVDLRQAAGEDWPLIAGNEPMLSAFALALLHRRMRERGEVPPHYTSMTECRSCGPVPIFPGVPERVLSCPWCFVRLEGKQVPRPLIQPSLRVVGRTVGGVQVVVEGESR